VSPGEPGASSASSRDDPDSRNRGSAAGFWRGAELSKLLVLLVIAVVGWVLVWKYMTLRHEAAADLERFAPGAGPGLPAKIEPDRNPAFESVTDRTPIGLRDMAAYDLLLTRAREIGAAELARRSQGTIYFTDLWERPGDYRGVPVHILGTARRIISYESKRSPRGRLYEAWIGTHDSQGYPYVCIFEERPQGLPMGPEVSERVVFNGYFLKQLRYLSGKDIPRAAPVLVGRIGWTPGRAAPGSERPVFWMAMIVGGMFLISLYRWIAGLRRSLSRRNGLTASTSSLINRPTEEIAPEDLAQWVESVREAEDDGPREADRE
jgi:hypothetical protein